MRVRVIGALVFYLASVSILNAQDQPPVRIPFVDCNTDPEEITDVYPGDSVIGSFYSESGMIPESASLEITEAQTAELAFEDTLLLPSALPSGFVDFNIFLPEDFLQGTYLARLQQSNPEGLDFNYCAKFRFLAMGGIIGNGIDDDRAIIKKHDRMKGNAEGIRIQSLAQSLDESACGSIRSSSSSSAVLMLFLILSLSLLVRRRRPETKGVRHE